ncbi:MULTISPECIES: hypothetical protein [Pseudomonas]|uniref:Aconitase B n=2 Tax=Pseudomonadaceae TaxID=135621 RepID=A0A7Y1MPB6_9PSED|nr:MULTISPECIES: hypothetical protein [Pseudomonas]MCF5508336.1 hypothetical protein [Pseudomonas sp. PA-3-6H]MCF5517529.1 hypothetical protein [Pseudomonas sp. PA-3-6E]MCF5562190.1 hypothetical protein [Pseudomonas sp. PA-3-5D]MCF5569543.1 hypothetical protein [Pseudomonas sp. PA-3-11C]MCF5592927.1 hypothetical protein [Pseudomonas sp. PA-3-10C]
MSRQSFEYHTAFTPLNYLVRTKKLFMFKSEEPTTEPDVEGFLQDLEHQQRLALLGREGWELISVQPVVKGEVKIGNQNAQGWAYGIALPTGYLLFFKRPISSD